MDSRSIVRYTLKELVHYSGFSKSKIKYYLFYQNPPFNFFDLVNAYIRCSFDILGGNERYIDKNNIYKISSPDDLRLRKIEYDLQGKVNKFYPYLLNKIIVINPYIKKGKPTLERKEVAIKDIVNNYLKGKSFNELLDIYQCHMFELEEVIRFEIRGGKR